MPYWLSLLPWQLKSQLSISWWCMLVLITSLKAVMYGLLVRVIIPYRLVAPESGWVSWNRFGLVDGWINFIKFFTFGLIHWDKMTNILETFPSVFSCMKTFVFWWNLFPRIQLTISHHLFRHWLDNKWMQTIIWTNNGLNFWCLYGWIKYISRW